jgi:hypothetical protein
MALPLSITSCSGDPEYNYTTPSSICETDIDSTALRNVLPPGDEFHAATRNLPVETCEVRIDDTRQVNITAYSYDQYRDPADYASVNEFTNPTAANLTENGEGLLWDGGAVVAWQCHNGEEHEDYRNVLAVINIYGDQTDGEEGREKAAEFARSYATGLTEKLRCEV